jgi:transposase-like protein
MDYSKFIDDIQKKEKLNPKVYWPLKGQMNRLDMKKIVTLTLEDSEDVNCGHCGSDKYVKNGRKNDLQRYKCKSCGREFNQLTGTPLARLRKKGRWLKYSECLNKGYSVRKAATTVGVDKKTSFKWRHKFLKNANMLFATKLNGIVESKETSFKYSEKGAKAIRHPEKLGTDVYVLASVDRDSWVTTPIIDSFEIDSIKAEFKTQIANDSLMFLNGGDCVEKFVNDQKCNYVALNSQNVHKSYEHIRNVQEYIKSLKLWMKRFRGVATKYLNNYLSWFRELFEYLMDVPEKVLLVRAKSVERFPYHPFLSNT